MPVPNVLAYCRQAQILQPKSLYNVYGQSPSQRTSLAEAAEAAHWRWLGNDGQPTARKVENVSRLSNHLLWSWPHSLKMGSCLFPDSETYKNKNTLCHLIELAFKWNSAFLTFSFVIEGTSKRCCNFWRHWNQFTTKTFVFMYKIFIINTVIKFKQ